MTATCPFSPPQTEPAIADAPDRNGPDREGPLSFPLKRDSVLELPHDYIALREFRPVASIALPTGAHGFLVSRYDDVKTVLTDPRFSRADTIKPGAPRFSAVDFPPGSLFTLDPPDHTRLRKLAADRFTGNEVRQLRPYVEQVVDDLLDTLADARQPVDLNDHLCFALPVIVICELLGVPADDRHLFRRWADASVALTADPADSLKRQIEMFTYFGALVKRKRGQGGDDLLTRLIEAHDESGELGEYQLMLLAMTILVAGFETTASVLGTGAMTLLLRPEMAERLRADPAFAEPLVEELLRVNPIGDGGPIRITKTDVELAGTLIPQGSLVIASVSSANFDARAFPDPREFDPDRAGQRHLAFGHGVHFCLGAALARLELQVALGKLVTRFPAMRLAVPVDELRMTTGMLFHRLERLPVHLA